MLMPPELMGLAIGVAFAAGYTLSRQITIKECRRLYNLGADLNRFYVEHTHKDLAFNEFKSEAVEGLNPVSESQKPTSIGRVA